jgi:hypothetical protein
MADQKGVVALLVSVTNQGWLQKLTQLVVL